MYTYDNTATVGRCQEVGFNKQEEKKQSIYKIYKQVSSGGYPIHVKQGSNRDKESILTLSLG